MKTYKITVNNKRPTAPSLTGGSDNWVVTAPNIKVSSVGTAISGVKHYEYYKSTSSMAPTDSTTATGTTTTGEVTISDEGTTYIWYRTVSNNDFKSVWSSFQATTWKPLKIVTLTLFYIANLIFENITFFRKILKKAPLKITIFSKKFRQYFSF